MRTLTIALVLIVVSCSHAPASNGDPKAAPAPATSAPAPTPEARARDILEHQLVAASSEGLADADEDKLDSALRATFAPDTVISEEGGERAAIKLHASLFDRISIDTLAAVGDTDFVCFTATFHDSAPNGWRNPSSPASWFPARYVAVASRASGWNVVAASIVQTGYGTARGSGKVESPSFPGATTSTALSALVLDGPTLARAVSAKTMVIGLDGRAVASGPQALGPWAARHLVLDPDARELTAATWATFQANAVFSDGKDRGNLGVFVAARKTAGGWEPVLVQYLGR